MILEDKKASRGWVLLLVCVALCAGLDVLILVRPDLLNHNSEYQWRVLWHGKRGALLWVWLLWSVIMVMAFLAWSQASKKLKGAKLDGLAAGLIFILGILSPLVFFQIDRFGANELLVRIFVQDHTGYFSDAAKFKTRENLLAAYRDPGKFPAQLSTHGRTHPPADALIFMALNRASEKSGVLQGIHKTLFGENTRKQIDDHFHLSLAEQTGGMLGLFMILIAASFAATLGYFLLRKFFSADLCFVSGLALVSMPAFCAKTPVMDQVFAVFILGAALVALSGKKRRWRQGLSAGFIIGAGAWLSPGVWSAGLLIPFLIAAKEFQTQPVKSSGEIFKSIMIVGLPALAGAALAVWIGSFVVQANYLDIFQINRNGWYYNNDASGRVSRLKWILFNPYEYLFWSSFPIFLGFLVKFGQEIRKFLDRTHEPGKIDAFFWFSLIFIIILNISGQICYESPRLCWFFLPILANLGISGFHQDMQNLHNKALILMIILTALQTCILLIVY